MAKRKPLKTRPWLGGGVGGPDVWRKLAQARLGVATSQAEDLATLGLQNMPVSIQELKREYRQHMLKVHPDHGGTNEDATKATLAYARLLRVLEGT